MERVIGTKQIGGDRYEIVQTGSGKKTKRFLRKVGKALKKGAKFAKKTKLVSKGLKTIADLAPVDDATEAKLRAASKVAKKAGFGVHSGSGLRTAGRGLKTAGRHGGRGKGNPWLAHVKAYRAKHPNKSYKESLMEAKKTYKKGSGLRTAGRPR